MESIFSLVSGKIKKIIIGSHFGLKIVVRAAPGASNALGFMRAQKESKISGTTHAILMNDGALESIFSLVSGKIKKQRIGSHFGLQIACQRAPGEFKPEVLCTKEKNQRYPRLLA